MKIALFYCDVGAPSRALRLAELAMLNQLLIDAGFEVDVVLLGWFDALEDSALQVPNAQLYAFFLDEWNWAATATCAQRVQSHYPQSTFLAFGIYASIAPENVLRSGRFHFLIAGEWETAFLEFANALKKERVIPPLRNVWEFRSATDIRRTPLRPLIESLDTLPTWNRSLAKCDWELPQDDGTLYLWASRGCPFECSYCYLPVYQRAYAGKESFRRQRSPAHVAGELLSETKRANYSHIVFVDEIFPPQKEWLRGLVKHLRGISLPPWEATIAVEEVNEECLSLLREAGCKKLHVGIETGNEVFRRRLGNRNLSNAALSQFCQLAHEHDIAVSAHVMIGLPRETESVFHETLSFLRELEVDEIYSHRYFPIEKTPLGEYARPAGMSKARTCEALFPPLTVASYGEVPVEMLTQFERQVEFLNIERVCRALPERDGLSAIDLIKNLAAAKLAMERGGCLVVRMHYGVEGIQAVVILQPPLAIAFPRMTLSRGTMLRLSLALPEKTRRCLAATKATLFFRVLLRDGNHEHSLFEKSFGGHGVVGLSDWQELILPLPPQTEAGELIIVTHCSRDDLGRDVRLWIAEPALIQEATFILARDKEQRLREDLSGQLRAVQAQLQKTQEELARALERERQLAEECEKKTKRLSEVHIQMLELEKRCEELEQALLDFTCRKSLWQRFLDRVNFRKRR